MRQQYGGTGPGSVDPRACDNELMLRYYKAQGIVGEDEWADFERSLRSSLPMVLRVLQSRPGWEGTIAELQRRGDGVLTSLDWCGPLVWQCASSTYSTHSGGELRRWCQQQNTRGTASFQEAVSMLPPLLLAPQPDHLVLDMCAAPGSKTMQLLDGVHAMDDWGAPGQPRVATGLLVAVDVSGLKMTSVVAGRLRKIHSPALALAVGNSKNFPFLRHRSQSSSELTEGILFDRILCDVPCTGDGTIRKNPSIWSSWRLDYALRLHSTQLRLLRRGLRLLRPGGRLVYSTCSLNPIENEAVVLSALRAFPGRVSLEDASSLANLTTQRGDGDDGSLRVCKGMRSWSVPDVRCTAAGNGQGRAPAKRSTTEPGEIRSGDWQCLSCGVNVFAYRLNCFKCKASKPSSELRPDICSKPEPKSESEVESQQEPEPERESEPESWPDPEVDTEPAAGDTKHERVVFDSLADVPPEMLRSHTPGAPLLTSMFPDRPVRAAGDGVDGDEATDASLRAMLERCIRILPHHNDTGGFFIAVFRRDYAEGANRRGGESSGGTEADTSATAVVAASSHRPHDYISHSDSSSDEEGVDDAEKTSDATGVRHDAEDSPNAEILPTGGNGTAISSEHGSGTMYYAKQRYALLDSNDSSTVVEEIWRSLTDFYGLSDVVLQRQNLAVVFDPDGEARKIDLLSPGLRDLLRGDIGSQSRLQFVSLGMRAFKRLEAGFLKPALCRWRPCHESAEYIARAATRRRVRLAHAPLLEFLSCGRLDIEKLAQLERDGQATGLQQECNAWPELKDESLGGVVVGCLLPIEGEAEGHSGRAQSVAAATAASRVWIAGALTRKHLESYADKAELAMGREILECSGSA